MHSKSPYDRDRVTIAPFVLLPTSFPKNEFKKAKRIQSTFNTLMHKVAHDYEFLAENLNNVQSDEFTAKLFAIYKTVHNEGQTQPLSLGLLRSDYMLHTGTNMEIIQVELNAIASSFGGLSTRVSQYHRYILKELGHSDKIENIPENFTVTGLASGLTDAWTMYNDDKAVILFIVEDITYNICDQRAVEFEIRRLNKKIKVIRRTFKNLINEEAHLGPNKELIVGEHVVALAYYRTGYQVEAYPGTEDWSMRLLIERSRAIKCPSIQYQLAGTKKIQQVLAQPNVLNRFLNKVEAESIRQVFTGLYSLELNDDGDKAVAMAIENPKNFVLKPQREGGGNNVYGEEVATVLKSMRNSVDRTCWILMDRIDPPVQENYIVRSGKETVLQDITTELGIYGVIIGNHNEIIVNRQVGHVLRSKPVTSNEGGILGGAGALDSPYLVA
ncbi:glutathione synthetase-like isoform X2 [Venturia canescens]|nr:glutathione synthetase-like isoform X2 [Venturia canescens]